MIPFNPVGLAIALAVGWIIKNKTPISNQAIPVINFALQFLTAVVGSLIVTPAEAGVLGFVGKVGAGLLPFALEAVFTTVQSIGVHSGGKATGRFTLAIFKKLLLVKGIEVAVKEVER